jgi:hypothetical protein
MSKPQRLPPTGTRILIVRKPGFRGQAQGVYKATLPEGFLFTPPSNDTLNFCGWEDLDRLQSLDADGHYGEVWE